MPQQKKQSRFVLNSTSVPQKPVEFQNDTIPADSPEDASAWFISKQNAIQLFIKEEHPNEFSQSATTLAHEYWHKHIHKTGALNLQMGLEERYKVAVDNELSASIVGLLQLRQEYLNAKTTEERNQIANSDPAKHYAYYFSAVEQGKINPFSASPQDFQNEMQFIARETQKMWQNHLSVRYDQDQLTTEVLGYFQTHSLEELKPNPKNYQKARKTIYTIGGIDFSQYLDDTNCINDNMRTADKLVAQSNNRYKVLQTLQPQNMSLDFSQAAYISALEPIKQDLLEVFEIRQQWFNCSAAEQQELIATSPLAQQYLIALQNKQIKPNPGGMALDEEKFIGQLLRQECVQTIYNQPIEELNFDMIEQARTAIKNNTNDKAFQLLVQKQLSAYGIDFSKYLKGVEDAPFVANPKFAEIDAQIRAGLPTEEIWKKANLCYYDLNSEIFAPEIKLDEKLSPEQQLKLAEQQMFVANVMWRHPELFCRTCDNNAELKEMTVSAFEEFKKELAENPTLAAAWQNQKQEIIRKISQQSAHTLFIADDNDEAYQKAINQLYTYHGQNLKKIYGKDVEELLPKTSLETELVKENFFMRLKNKCVDGYDFVYDKTAQCYHTLKNKTKELWHTVFDNAAIRKEKIAAEEDYRGEPIYDEWEPEHRVSEPLEADIYDFEGNSLRDQYHSLLKQDNPELAQLFVQAELNQSKMNMNLKKRQIQNDNITEKLVVPQAHEWQSRRIVIKNKSR